MTQLRKHRDAISNYFDELESGIGKRGSSFTDIDGVSHDGDTDCFLIREFKLKDELLDKAQRRTLQALARLPNCTVWFCRKLPHGRIAFGQFGSGRRAEVISEDEYRHRVSCWWNGVDPASTPVSDVVPAPPAPTAPRKPTFEQLLENDTGTTW